MEKLYWINNTAKMRVLKELLSTGKPTLVFDYGCGSGGEWPDVLADHPQITFIGYEPDAGRATEARERLASVGGKILSGDELHGQDFKADAIVSFSVFEHVYDRRAYLLTAKRLLAPDGRFYLNYDDGHFRNDIDLNRPDLWWSQAREWVHNLGADFFVRVGRIDLFQKRVTRPVADTLVREAGFSPADVFYSNIGCLKNFPKLAPSDAQQRLAIDLLEFEQRMHTYIEDRDEYLGDRCNLWRVMHSRTLVLKHA